MQIPAPSSQRSQLLQETKPQEEGRRGSSSCRNPCGGEMGAGILHPNHAWCVARLQALVSLRPPALPTRLTHALPEALRSSETCSVLLSRLHGCVCRRDVPHVCSIPPVPAWMECTPDLGLLPTAPGLGLQCTATEQRLRGFQMPVGAASAFLMVKPGLRCRPG